jgi:hypothetical protein
MMADLGDVSIGPGDVMALGRQSLTPGEAPAALVGAYPAEHPAGILGWPIWSLGLAGHAVTVAQSDNDRRVRRTS